MNVAGEAKGAKLSQLSLTTSSNLIKVQKAEGKGRTKAEVDQIIRWLTGYDELELERHLAAGTTFADFFAEARLNPSARLITGVICGMRVETIEDPLMQQIRYLDKLVDELAKGRPLEKVLRS